MTCNICVSMWTLTSCLIPQRLKEALCLLYCGTMCIVRDRIRFLPKQVSACVCVCVCVCQDRACCDWVWLFFSWQCRWVWEWLICLCVCVRACARVCMYVPLAGSTVCLPPVLIRSLTWVPRMRGLEHCQHTHTHWHSVIWRRQSSWWSVTVCPFNEAKFHACASVYVCKLTLTVVWSCGWAGWSP